MDIIMIRHGETEDNVKKVYSRDDTSLTEKGIRQIMRTKELLKKYDYEEIHYSPLKRTVETLNLLGLEGKEDIRIREINFGIFTGKTFEEISNTYPAETKSWIEDISNYKIPEGESLLDVYERVREFLEEICKIDKNVLLVTHDTVIRLALCWVFDNPAYFYRFKVDNGSISTITVDHGFKYIRQKQ